MQVPSPTMLIDVVDGWDRVLGTIPRSEALTAHVRFRVAHVFIFHHEGALLLQQLAPERDRHPLRWGSSVAGYLFSGETYEQAARRRAAQELGVRDLNLEPAGVTPMRDTASAKFIGLFTAIHDGPFRPLAGQIARLEWFPPDDLKADIETHPNRYTPTFLHLFRYYYRPRR